MKPPIRAAIFLVTRQVVKDRCVVAMLILETFKHPHV
ncbi:hypothetical protein GEPA3_2842 [Geobacillus sp. PA-3]|nr:hypothetical protein GEPA3_2842 [Geobacillus sp. PA-3]